jgi:hypothetical protein
VTKASPSALGYLNFWNNRNSGSSQNLAVSQAQKIQSSSMRRRPLPNLWLSRALLPYWTVCSIRQNTKRRRKIEWQSVNVAVVTFVVASWITASNGPAKKSLSRLKKSLRIPTSALASALDTAKSGLAVRMTPLPELPDSLHAEWPDTD